MPVTDFLDEKHREITTRLEELKPLVDEYGRLDAAAQALNGIGATTIAAPRGRKPGRRPGRPKGTKSTPRAAAARPARDGRKTSAAKPRRGRRKGSGGRSAEALALVTAQPGIKIPELAKKMGINQSYLYHVLPGLRSEGKVEDKDRAWYPAAAVTA
jgi:hypothetical protein